MNVIKRDFHVQPELAFVREGFVTFSPAQAETVLERCQFDGQRNVSPRHVQVLSDIMKNGQWMAKDKIDFASINGDLILINGYHRMNAQAYSGVPIEWTVIIHHCANEQDVRSLYYKFDTNTKTRSGNQILDGVNFAEQYGLSRNMAQAVFRAVPFIAAGFSTSKNDHDHLTNKVMDRRLAMAATYANAARAYDQCIAKSAPGFKRKFLNGGFAAVALATLRYQPDMAMEFWTGVALNDGLRRGDPRQTLFNDMNSRAFNKGHASQGMVVPAAAWNAYYEGRNIKIIKVYDRTQVRIAGTPFDR